MQEIEKKIEEFLRDQLYVDVDSIEPETPIFSEGVVDSMALLQIIEFLEESERIEVVQEDVIPENFDGVRKLARFIISKTTSD